MRSPDLSLCTLDEIKNNLRKQGVTDAKQISIQRNNQIIPTNTYILNFNTPKPPTEIKIGYLITKVETYIPNPLRCHNCQKFGHYKEKCTRPPICKNCEETGNHIDCQQPLLYFDLRPSPKNAIPRWYTGRKWHIPMASNRKRSHGRIKAYDMGKGEGPILPLQSCTGRE